MFGFWLVVLIACVVVETATLGLVSIWFAFGAVGALIACAMRAKFIVQIVVFLTVSGAVLALLRPFARRCLAVRAKPTNADRAIGMICPVTEDIDNIQGTGAVALSGKTWTARSLTGENIPSGEYVRVQAIQGVKLIVEETSKAAAEAVK